jgi:hypothetical protein
MGKSTISMAILKNHPSITASTQLQQLMPLAAAALLQQTPELCLWHAADPAATGTATARRRLMRGGNGGRPKVILPAKNGHF